MNIFYVSYFVQDGNTPLHIACRKGHNETAVALLDKGADIHVKDYVSISITLTYNIRKSNK